MAINDTFEHGLRPAQIIGSLRIQQQRRMILADQPGAGKTAQAMVALEIDGQLTRRANILILCNVTGCQLTWAPEIQKRIVSQYDVVVADLTDTEGRKTMPSVAARDAKLAAKLIEADDEDLPLIVLANFDMLRWPPKGAPKMATLFDIVFDSVLIDEGHLVLPTQADKLDSMSQFWRGLSYLQRSADPILLDITGTPDRGKLHNRYGHWKFLFPTQFRDFWGWARTHFVVSAGSWVGAEIGKLRNPAAWQGFDNSHMIRRTKKEMLKGLPEKQWANDGGIDLPLTPVQQLAYDSYMSELEERHMELLAQADDTEEGKKAKAKADALRLQFALRSRQMATATWVYTTETDENGRDHTHGTPQVLGVGGSAKLAWLLNWMDERGYLPEDWDPSQGKVVIVSYFTQILEWLKLELQLAGVRAEVLSGDTPGVTKTQIEAQFQRGDLRVVLLSGHIGVSINLDAADDMIFLDLTHDPDKIEQAEDRIHRASRNHQVTYWRLISQDTSDVVVVEMADSRYRATRESYDGSRGVEFARRFMPASYQMTLADA